MVNLSRRNHSAFSKWLWTVDKVILFVSLALLTIGIILDVTASPAVARTIHVDDFWFVRKQVFYVIASVVVIFVLSMFRLKTIRQISIAGFVVVGFLLVLTLFFGFETKGARRWMSIFGFSMQASEFMKPIFIIVTAWLLDCGKKYDYFPGMWISILLFGAVAGLLLLQPDVGMTLLVTAVFGLQLFLAGLPIWIVSIGVIGGLGGLVLLYFTFPHFHARVDQFLYGSNETSYQINKAMQAFQNGNLVGKGPGEVKYSGCAHRLCVCSCRRRIRSVVVPDYHYFILGNHYSHSARRFKRNQFVRDVCRSRIGCLFGLAGICKYGLVVAHYSDQGYDFAVYFLRRFIFTGQRH